MYEIASFAYRVLLSRNVIVEPDPLVGRSPRPRAASGGSSGEAIVTMGLNTTDHKATAAGAMAIVLSSVGAALIKNAEWVSHS